MFVGEVESFSKIDDDIGREEILQLDINVVEQRKTEEKRRSH